MFEVALKMRDFAGLQARLNKDERIPPQELAATYEPSVSYYQKVVDWLKSQGFTIVREDSHHLAVFARGKVSQVASSFKVNFARVTADGKDYTSAITAPSVPSDLAPLLLGINGLQPHLHAHKHVIQPQVQPNASTGNTSYLPSQVAAAYGLTSLYNKKISGGGQTIAIVIDTFPSTTDLLLFWKNCNVNQSISNVSYIQAVPGQLPSASEDEEVALDVEWSSAMAPGARIRVYATVDLDPADVDLGYHRVLDDVTNHPELGIHQMSMSFGEGETEIKATAGGPDSDTQAADQTLALLANAGVTLFASSGDGGATPGTKSSSDETGPLQVEYPSTDPNVVAVGGTTLAIDSNNSVTAEKAWNNATGATGGGISIFFSHPTTQTGPGTAPSAKRQVPDVAASADPNAGAILYFSGAQTVVGGTSWSSPMWAAFCALINQARTNAGLNPLGTAVNGGTTETLVSDIYPLMAGSNYATNFRDITSGSNITSSSGAKYSATVDYDMVSGVGAPHVDALAQTLIGTGTLLGVQMPPAFVAEPPGQDATFSVAVGEGSATYQWQRMPIGSTTWSNLADNTIYAGSASAALTVTNVSPAMSGDEFQCIISLSDNVVSTSTPCALVVDSPMIISTLAGTVGVGAMTNGTGTGANFNIPSGIAIDSSSNLYIADYSNNAIREVTSAGVVTTPAYTFTTSGDAFNAPNAVAIDPSNTQNNLFVADTGNNLIRKVVNGVVTTFSTGTFNIPEGVAVDHSGSVYVADTGSDTIRKITAAGVASILAGQSGTAGYADGNATTMALFSAPSAVAVDASGNVYVADFGNSVVRKISGGVVSTVAGQAGVAGYMDGPGTEALFNTPSGITVDSAGNVYLTDCLVPATGTNAAGDDLVRKISTTGAVSTLAGQAGFAGSSDGIGSTAQFYSLQAVALNAGTGTFYFADTYNQTIRVGTIEPLPVLSLNATTPLAIVFGSVPGEFTVTRAGGDPTLPVNVTYAVANASSANAGTAVAVAGTDYTTLPGAVVIPANATSATIGVSPISDNQAPSAPTFQLALAAGPGYTIGTPSSASITIEEMTPFQTWSSSEFGAGATSVSIGSETADPNNNGVPNLLEFAFGADPLQAGTDPSPAASIVIGSDNLRHMAITYSQNLNATSLTYTVEVTSDVSQVKDQWRFGSAFTTLVSRSSPNNDIVQVTVMDNTPLSTVSRRFIRLQVGEN